MQLKPNTQKKKKHQQHLNLPSPLIPMHMDNKGKFLLNLHSFPEILGKWTFFIPSLVFSIAPPYLQKPFTVISKPKGYIEI